MNRKSFIVGTLVGLSLFSAGCASFFSIVEYDVGAGLLLAMSIIFLFLSVGAKKTLTE